MKLFFDARYTRTTYHDGISRYSVELGNALAHLTPVTFLISDEAQKKWFPKDAAFIKIHPPTSVKEPFTALLLNKYKPDVVYSPMQTIGTLGKKYRAVLTVHDMIYYHHGTPPGTLPLFVRIGWRIYHQTYLFQKLILKGGDLITTVSHTTASDLHRVRMTQRQAVVVYNAPQKFNAHPVRHEGDIKHIIYMGSFMPYKNVETLIKGMEHLPGRTLHLLSRISTKRQMQLEAIIPTGAQVVFHNGVSDDEYEALLADNAVLATASLDEGYGIPVAEALAMGVPAVVSDIPIFHEVGGDGAVYFDPKSPQAFAASIKQLDDGEFRSQRIQLGTAHIQSFSWDRSAKVLLDAIKSIL